MDIENVRNILKKHEIYDDAEKECRDKKFTRPLYNTQKVYDVYYYYLNKKFNNIRNEKDELEKKKSLHDKDHSNKIEILSSDMKELKKAMYFLESASEDFLIQK